MNKELEALDNLLEQKLIKPDKHFRTIGNIASLGQVMVIKNGLERKEKLEKAWKIVKNKNVSIRILNDSDSVEAYNEVKKYALCTDDLTETEFNLLKEMLGEK